MWITVLIRTVGVAVMMAIVMTAASCRDDGTKPPLSTRSTPSYGVDVDPFLAMARTADCADAHNHVYVIDHALVFWDRAGKCPDNSYGQMLYGERPESTLCHLNDSIAGPQRGCSDARFESMFDVIVSHLDAPDLGLGPTHIVERVPL
jgi:hypothetical protein